MKRFFLAVSFIFASTILFPWTVLALETADETRLRLILEKSLNAYEAVKDYSAIFLKQEESEGQLGEQETIFLKFEKPFKVFMHWLDTDKKGLQVLYERGRHDGKLAIHKPGLLLGLAPVVFLEQDSPWVREGSESYDIEDAGIGVFLTDLSEMVLKGSQAGMLRVNFEEGRDGEVVETFFPGTAPDTGYFAYRVKAIFDPASYLPVKMMLYDWNDKLTGIYEYRELKVNVGMDDPEFKKLAHKRLYRFYTPEAERPAKTQNFTSRTAASGAKP